MSYQGVTNIFEFLEDENDEEGGKKVVVSVPKPETNQGKAKSTGKDQPKKNETAPSKAPVKERSERPPRKEGERPPRREGDGERPPRREGERPPRREGERPPRREGERPPRREGDGERPPRREGERPPRREDGERPPRREDGERPPRRPREPRIEGGPTPSTGEGERSERPPRSRTEGRVRREFKEGESDSFKGTKRTFDRRSGTGRGKEVKRSGGGRGNWGKEPNQESWDEAPEKVEGTEEKPETGEKPVESEPVAPVKEESDEEKKKREEEEKKRKEDEEKEQRQMTLEDYRKKLEAEKAEKGTVIPSLPAPRQAGEGVDSKELQKWASFTAIKRDEDEEPEVEVKENSTSSETKKRKEPKKQIVSVDSIFRVQAPKKPRASKEDRFDRGDRPDRAPRRDREFNKESPRGPGKRPRGGAPDVQDASSFPALSTKA